MRSTSFVTVALCLCLAACSDDSGQAPAPDAKPSSDMLGVDSSSADGGSLADQSTTAAAKICGRVVDSSGAPIAGAKVQACNEQFCHPGETDTQGAYCLATFDGAYALHALEQPDIGGKRYGDAFAPLNVTAAQVAGGERVEVGTLTLVELGAGKIINAATSGRLELSGGVVLDLPAGSLKLPPFVSETSAAAAVVPIAALHPALRAAAGGGKTLVSALLIVPAEASLQEPATLELPAPAVSQASETLELWTVDAIGGAVSQHTSGVVDAQGKLQVKPSGGSGGLRHLGLFLLYR